MTPKRKSPLVYEGMKLHHQKRDPVRRGLAWVDMMLPHDDAIEHHKPLEEKNTRWTFVIAAFMTGILIVGLGTRLFYMQVIAGERYVGLANGNRLRETISYAPRGRILDRNGKVLAENTIAFQLTVTPYLLAEDGTERADDYRQIAEVAGIDQTQLQSISESKGTEDPLPILVKENVSHHQALIIEQMLPRVKGFSLDQVPTRHYVADAGLAHILGYVGRVDEDELAADTTNQLLPTDFIGKSGVESTYDQYLRGGNGRERTEVDALGRPVRLLAQASPQPGNDIYLTIDYDLQVRLDQAIREQMAKSNTSRGAGVMIDPNNGEVLAMVSIPYFDNNLFAEGISQADFDKLVNDPGQPLTNKAIAGAYTSGSTIKPVVASAALQEGVVKPETVIVDSGYIDVTSQYQPGAYFRFHGWRPGGLGPMDARKAIAWSSNIYFYTVGGGHGNIQGLGGDRLARYYRAFGLGAASGIDLPYEIDGRVPDPEWKLANTGEEWFVGDSYNTAIGQGDLLVSPLQMTVAHSAVANNGSVLKPQLLYKVGDRLVAQKAVRSEVPVSKENLQIVREGMRQVLTGGTTCECTFKNVPVHVAGKSGTAETNTPGGRKPHAWFLAYAPYENPKILGAVILEEGSGGSQFSAPAISSTMELYFSKYPAN